MFSVPLSKMCADGWEKWKQNRSATAGRFAFLEYHQKDVGSVKLWSHTPNQKGHPEPLSKHLDTVARLSRDMAGRFGFGEMAYTAGLLHDIGKFAPAWQRYIHNPSPGTGIDHKGAGAILAHQAGDPVVAAVIAGHHGGLHNRSELPAWLQERAADPEVRKAIALAQQQSYGKGPAHVSRLPAELHDKLARDFGTRMLLSALVDADRLDTEAHFDLRKAAVRNSTPRSLAPLWERLQTSLGSADAPLVFQHVTSDIIGTCLKAATGKPGLYRLVTPAGAPVAVASMAFALQHALQHELERVVIVAPDMVALDPLADVYSSLFEERAVLRDYGAMREPKVGHNDGLELSWETLAGQNWDARVIVSTQAMLFETMFGHRTRPLRKLHRLARSVIVLTDCHALPEDRLLSLMDGMQTLVHQYGATIVLCSSSQPDLNQSASAAFLWGMPGIHAIGLRPTAWFDALRQSNYLAEHSPASDKLLTGIRQSRQCLTVCNDEDRALRLIQAISDPSLLYLGPTLCGAHRNAVVAEARRRLTGKQACRLVSTQWVDIGIATTFPHVIRVVDQAKQPQTAGDRKRRHADHGVSPGQFFVFRPKNGKQPAGFYPVESSLVEQHVVSGEDRLRKHQLVQDYLDAADAFSHGLLDRRGIQALRRRGEFQAVSDRMRFDEITVPVLVHYRPAGPGGPDPLHDLLCRLHKDVADRNAWRELNRYVVRVSRAYFDTARHDGKIREPFDGACEWIGAYHPIWGLAQQ